jgi:hypothetical protein
MTIGRIKRRHWHVGDIGGTIYQVYYLAASSGIRACTPERKPAGKLHDDSESLPELKMSTNLNLTAFKTQCTTKCMAEREIWKYTVVGTLTFKL